MPAQGQRGGLTGRSIISRHRLAGRFRFIQRILLLNNRLQIIEAESPFSPLKERIDLMVLKTAFRP